LTSRDKLAPIHFVRFLSSALVLLLLAHPSRAGERLEPLQAALGRFEFGDYEAVVELLRPFAESGGEQLPHADRLEALRTYGLACALTGRRTAAEGAFVLLLKEDPTAQLDPTLVPPEAVRLFESVRARFFSTSAPPPPLPSYRPAWASFGVAGGLAAGCIVFAGLSVAAKSEYDHTTIERVASDAADRYRIYSGLSIGFGVGAAALVVVGAGLYGHALRVRRARAAIP
jgi:hypothetical protein